MSANPTTPEHPARLITFYLPQFHPIPENNEWWGQGFTEWTNVTKARPRYLGHHQPHYPTELGYYDLRVPEVREAQADLARTHGIHGFCYYHYWFGGRRLLERPFNDVLASGKPDFPFCLCWANEPWSRRWDGSEQQVLMAQNYSEEDDLAHIRYLAEIFRDPRYIRIDGKPFFLIYQYNAIPNIERTTTIWREEARRLGIGELFLGLVESHYISLYNVPNPHFDTTIEFLPTWNLVGRRRLPLIDYPFVDPRYLRYKVCSYEHVMRQALAKPEVDYERFRTALVDWDNSARRKKPLILEGSTPQLYQEWLTRLIEKVQEKPSERRVVFVSSWNEWAEGNHLEPDRRWGRAYLEATRAALDNVAAAQGRPVVSASPI